MSTRFALGLALSMGLLLGMPAQAAPMIGLPADEVDAIKLRLIASKPNVSTVTVASFVFPGSGQAYMGHVDRTLVMWGGYLLAFSAAKVAIPDTFQTGGQKVSDLAVLGVFMAMAAGSAVDAYLLAVDERNRTDAVINRLAERASGLTPAMLLPITPVAP